MKKFAKNWACPHCGQFQTATSEDFATESMDFYMTESALGHIRVEGMAACCANPGCKMPMVHIAIGKALTNPQNGRRYMAKGEPYVNQRMIPDSSAKPQPDFIPAPLLEDYYEACKIRDLSPKASATLARRCLQGMIRDFCGIKGTSLFKEIVELRKKVETGTAPSGVLIDSVDAIDHVRSVGNIGAHMEKDINHIVPVDPNEAQLLIELVESLFEEWYVSRNRRDERLRKIKDVAESKKLLLEEKRSQVSPTNEEE
ncbi:DUF4145 domain-containing protein [uncultured Roseobacter sp.]|uniref:DUF4145 domain-containing protein n=1 Tax=uncultured Roseobacter sp. TaxID=114847 RepID=UPI0026117493|nr:DUF4145 domain-containing protein [uncultured Roseobacter sp.]